MTKSEFIQGIKDEIRVDEDAREYAEFLKRRDGKSEKDILLDREIDDLFRKSVEWTLQRLAYSDVS